MKTNYLKALAVAVSVVAFAWIPGAKATELDNYATLAVAVMICKNDLVGTPAADMLIDKLERYPKDSRARAGSNATQLVEAVGTAKFCELAAPLLAALRTVR